MCTLSWCFHPSGYSVFFNRDEQRARAPAMQAMLHCESGLDAIYPVDPKGGGTWLAVNAAGVTFALLNYYQGGLPLKDSSPNSEPYSPALISRGKIIVSLLKARSISEVRSLFSSLNLSCFASFTLVSFAKNSSPLSLKWDGQTLVEELPVSPVISSSVELPVVRQKRLAVYGELYDKISKENMLLVGDKEKNLLNTHRKFHCSHLPSKSQYSVCMHRGDAKSVSYSEVHVHAATASFKYIDQSPCLANAQNTSVCDLVLT